MIKSDESLLSFIYDSLDIYMQKDMTYLIEVSHFFATVAMAWWDVLILNSIIICKTSKGAIIISQIETVVEILR